MSVVAGTPEDDRNLSADNRPDFLKEVKGYDFTEMNKFVQPPRLKIIQDQTGPPLKPPFSAADCVVLPNNVKVAGLEQPFSFTPIIFFGTYACMNPFQMKTALPFIRESSNDDNSELAKKCRTIGYSEKCPENEKFDLVFSQFLNFMIILHDVNGLPRNMPVHIWAKRGEIKHMQVLMGLIQSRGAPPYACRFNAIPNRRSGTQGSWYGLDYSNDHQPWVENENEFKSYEKLHNDLLAIVKAGNLKPEYDDAELGGGENAATETRF